jgi:hypothetical protein
MCERLHTSPVVQKMQGGQKTPWNWRLFGPGPCWRRKKPKPLTAGASWHRAEVSGQFGPFRSASLWGRTPLSASAPSGDLFIYAKDLFVAASHWLVQKMTARDWRARVGFVTLRQRFVRRCHRQPYEEVASPPALVLAASRGDLPQLRSRPSCSSPRGAPCPAMDRSGGALPRRPAAQGRGADAARQRQRAAHARSQRERPGPMSALGGSGRAAPTEEVRVWTHLRHLP